MFREDAPFVWILTPGECPRRGLGRGPVPPPDRERPLGDVRHHQPRHHPIPDTRSNQVHGGNPPQRRGPPPRPPSPGPFTSLNTARDFDKPLTHTRRGHYSP